jgi:hypothetical protein
MDGKLLSKYNGNFIDLLSVDLPPLRPAKLWEIMDRYRNDPLGIKLKRYLARYHKTTLYTERSPGKEFYVSGEFAFDEEKMQVFTVRPNHFSDKDWNTFKSEIIVTMMHEHIHFMQWMFHEDTYEFILLHKETDKPDRQEEREYYASWGEIQAYSHCILMEMKDKNPNKPAAEMIRAQRVGYYSPTLKRIKSHFDGFDYPLKYLYKEILRWERKYEANAERLNIQ